MHYIDFYIDAKTRKIHKASCIKSSYKSNIYLGIFRNFHIALAHAESRGYLELSICEHCNVS